MMDREYFLAATFETTVAVFRYSLEKTKKSYLNLRILRLRLKSV